MDQSQLKARITQIYRDLDRYTYYELLKVTPQASPDEIRGAFHRMALSMHPDRYAQNPDAELRRLIYDIYKRVCEGYRVLMDHEQRAEYQQVLARGERRLVKKVRKREGPKRVEQAIKNPQAKKFFTMALAAERRGDLKTAKLNYKFALDLEPDHPTILERKEAVDAKA